MRRRETDYLDTSELVHKYTNVRKQQRNGADGFLLKLLIEASERTDDFQHVVDHAEIFG